MKNNFSGFTLLELLIGTAIAGVLLTILFTTLYQINRSKKNLDNVIHKSNRVSLIHHQLERDLMGAFVPVIPEVPESPKEDKKEEPVKPGEQKKEDKKEVEKKPQPVVDKIFFSENKGANIATLTFISNNPMPVYWSKKAGKPQPKIVRIVYRLVPDPAKRNSYKLMRQEGDELGYDAYDPGIPVEKQEFRPFEVIDGIKNLSAVYYYTPMKKPPQPTKPGEKPQEQKPEKKEYKTTKEWGKKKKDEKGSSEVPPVPRFVELTLVLWNADYKRDSTWKFTIPILPPAQPTKLTSQPSQQPKKEESDTKSQAPQGTTTPGNPGGQAPSLPSSPFGSKPQPSAMRVGIPVNVNVGPNYDKLPSFSTSVMRPGISRNIPSSSLNMISNSENA